MEIVDRDKQVLVNLATPNDIDILNSPEYAVTREQMGKGSIAMYKGESSLMYWILTSNNLFVRTLLEDEVIISEFENIYFDDLIICGTIQDEALTISRIEGATLVNIGGIETYYSGLGRVFIIPMVRMPIINEILTLKCLIKINQEAPLYLYYRYQDGSTEAMTLTTTTSAINIILNPPTHTGKIVTDVIIYMVENDHNMGKRFWINDLMILVGSQVDKHIQYFEGMKSSYEEQFDGTVYDIEITGSTRNKMTLEDITSMDVPNGAYTLGTKDGRETISFHNPTFWLNEKVNIELEPTKQYQFSYSCFYETSGTTRGVYMKVVYTDGTETQAPNTQIFNEWTNVTLRTVPNKVIDKVSFTYGTSLVDLTWFDINTLYCQEIGTNCDGSYYVEKDSNSLLLSSPILLCEGNEIDLVNGVIHENTVKVYFPREFFETATKGDDGNDNYIYYFYPEGASSHDNYVSICDKIPTQFNIYNSSYLGVVFRNVIIFSIPTQGLTRDERHQLVLEAVGEGITAIYNKQEPTTHEITPLLNTIETYNEHTILSTNTVIKPAIDYSVRRVGVTYDV